MSLINQMLKDLDARRDRPAPAHAAALQGMGLAGRPVSIPTLVLKPLLAGFAVLSVITLLFIFRPWEPAPVTPAITPDTVTPAAAQTPPTATQARTGITANPSEDTREPAVVPETALVAAEAEPDRDSRPATNPTAQGGAPDPVQAVARHPRPAVHLSSRQKAQLIYKRALAALDRNNNRSAETLLRQVFTLDAGLIEARVQLVALLLREQRLVDAELLLTEGLRAHPEHPGLAELYARMLVERGDNPRALGVLDQAGAANSQQADIRALRAAIQMKLGDPRAAVRDYRAALALQPQRAVWWMGLGVALEQAGDSAAALSAYRRAQYLPLATELGEFVKRRISVLSRKNGNRG